MRTTVVLALLVTAGYARADDARDWVEQAVHAHAGTDARLAKLKNFVQTAKGSVNFVGTDVPASREGQLSVQGDGHHALLALQPRANAGPHCGWPRRTAVPGRATGSPFPQGEDGGDPG